QFGTAAGAVIYGLMVARRVGGLARRWRLLAVSALAGLCLGELAWWAGGQAAAPTLGVVAYFAFPVLALAAILAVSHGFGGISQLWDASEKSTLLITGLDALVATTAFTVLVVTGRFGATSSVSLPHSGAPGVETAFAIIELTVVVIAALIAMVYPAQWPLRANCLLLVCGVVLILAADRIIAYFDVVGVTTAQSWAGIGLVLGPLVIAYAMREIPEQPVDARLRPMDWAQLILPYTGFFGATLQLAYHLLAGHLLRVAEVAVILLMVAIVAARQVVALGTQRVLTRRLVEAQHSLGHQVLHDSLTGLPNRLYFSQRLDEAMATGRFVLIFVDIDDFKEVNDRFGHAAGDALLCAVGERLARCVAEGDTLARIGGDEFAILVRGVAEAPDAVAERLRLALREPFAVHGSSLRVRASMGLVRPGDDAGALTSDDLLRQADISMYAGKRLGKNTAILYQPAAGVHVDFPSVLRQADGGAPDGFSLVYQPVVRLPGGVPVAVEALARWTAPNGVQVPPETFVSVAEAAGLGAALDAVVLDIACREVQDASLDVAIHVNLGAARLGNDEFEQRLWRILDQHGVDPARLVVEITETVPIVDLADAAAQITRFRAAGIRVALDDFGAGYNSLTYLHNLPVDTVKLDRGLAVPTDPERDLALYRSLVGLCRDLGIAVIAEGIESTGQAGVVLAAGCELAQGNLFGWPAPIAEVTARWPRIGEAIGANFPTTAGDQD
ncbi:MAG: EAL domain-containing protein, partial [Actinomycetota bacterium]|nr:EAL domain-containing protein [Actinomycetota bacterium]